ncbi:AAA family ATPase [uncultured Pseudokineococcus sp.]|uniref:AAA family ATPase n=1 Tax=uncultured Pseudokineococcus sp. TaxID=1642928 RepID=UPI00262E2689|nr:AAA family ATPase [uncultured Pseudokineococcus sp.]
MPRREAPRGGADERPSPWGLPVRRVEEHPEHPADRASWPAILAPVRQVLDEGLDLGPATVLVGENGSGKSTLVEALARAFGLPPEGGTTNTAHWADDAARDASPLHGSLRLVRGAGASRWGYFLRAETMHATFGALLEQVQGSPDRLTVSHGESYLSVLEDHFDDSGLYLLDEPESALSFTSQLALVGVLAAQVATGRAQVVVATHSPLVAALPGARLLEVSEDGLVERAWEDLDVVGHWRAFLDAPERYLRHVRPS